MLVLSRKMGEVIKIGGRIKLTVVRIGPNSVRIGIEAPPEMNIVREEIDVEADPDDEFAEIDAAWLAGLSL